VGNPNSILDVTDLVFIDPVGTGASRPAKGEKAEQFWGVDEDVESVGEFIRLFTTREQLWASPKFLCGESYGGVRASGLAQFLQDRHGLYLDGVISISGVINFEALWGGTLGLINYLPAYTATAHYHKKLPPDLQANRDKAIADSRAFAQGEYATALIKGNTLPADQRAKVIAQLVRFTGLEADLIDRANLRISSALFFENLLRKEGKIIGRFDGRVVAEDADRIDAGPEFDPSYTNVYGPFAAGRERQHPRRPWLRMGSAVPDPRWRQLELLALWRPLCEHGRSAGRRDEEQSKVARTSLPRLARPCRTTGLGAVQPWTTSHS
jgi:carboxypeptidase C (cathepsin A)